MFPEWTELLLYMGPGCAGTITATGAGLEMIHLKPYAQINQGIQSKEGGTMRG